MKQKRTKSTLLAFLLPAFLLCACTVGNEPGLPDGRYPITFAASVDGLIASRATTENTWNGTEEVAIQIDGEIKKYTAASGGNLTVASDGTPFYWQNTNNITVNAWYPYDDTKPEAADLKVKADQSGNTNYQASDYLEAVNATVTFANPELTFKHCTAKVVVTLKEGEGVTDVSGATVKFLNQTQVEGEGTEVIPNTTVTSEAYTALLIPIRIQNKQFIQVTIGTSGDARDYYYTPTDINLEAGKQYSYTITVKKEVLTVTAGTSVSWIDSDLGSNEAKEENP